MVTPSSNERARLNAEAAAWLARLNGPDGAAAEAPLQDWLNADPRHRQAFQRASDLWDLLPGAAELGEEEAPARRTQAPRRWVPAAIAASLALLVGGGAISLYLDQPAAFDTGVGEQRMATLDDGSRIALNTDSHVTAKLGRHERDISLDRGEALFDVAHDATRPFVVEAGGERITALGTSFVVRKDADRVRVTLLRGKVEVTQMGEPRRLVAVLMPGERVSVGRDGAVALDRPPLDAIVAWRRGELIFRDTPLSQAVAEMNRYGDQHLVVSDARLAALPISGVFATDNPAEFAAAVAQLHGLRLRREGGDVLLTR